MLPEHCVCNCLLSLYCSFVDLDKILSHNVLSTNDSHVVNSLSSNYFVPNIFETMVVSVSLMNDVYVDPRVCAVFNDISKFVYLQLGNTKPYNLKLAIMMESV